MKTNEKMNLNQGMEKLKELAVIMNNMFKLDSWDGSLNTLNVDCTSCNTRDERTNVDNLFDILGKLQDISERVIYLSSPVIAEGHLRKVGNDYMINGYKLSRNHHFEAVCPPCEGDDDYDTFFEFDHNTIRTWDYFYNFSEFEAFFQRVNLTDYLFVSDWNQQTYQKLYT